MPSATAATCDTSVLLPALLQWHPRHTTARAALRERVNAVPAHVMVETFSTMTRLPDPRRSPPALARDVLSRLRRPVLPLPAEAHLELLDRLVDARITGGATYDALIAATAAHHEHVLLTADHRAQQTYDALGTPYELV